METESSLYFSDADFDQTNLRRVCGELLRLLEREDLAGIVMLQDRNGGLVFKHLTPSWSRVDQLAEGVYTVNVEGEPDLNPSLRMLAMFARMLIGEKVELLALVDLITGNIPPATLN